MNDSLFLNPTYNEQLQKDGVVAIPFMSESEVLQVLEFYQEMHKREDPPSMYDGIHMTIWHNDLDYKLKIKTQLQTLLSSACERTFKNFRAVGPQFIVKRGGKDTTFPVHQDWSIVDENKFQSFNLWMPLQDVNESNGAMWIVKGSHRIQRKIRGAGILFPNYKPINSDLMSYATSFPLKAVEALLFFHNTIHGSPHNQNSTQRVVVQISILPKEAPLEIYFQKDKNAALEVHHPNDDFTYHYNKLREDSEMKPPTTLASEFRASYLPNEVTLEEVLTATKA